MAKRETSKIVELSGRKFKIEKFDALTGSYIAFTLFEKIMPMGLGKKLGIDDTLKNAPGRALMTRQEFKQLQLDALSIVSEILPAGTRPVIDEAGHWGVNDIDRDTALVLMLTIHALAFNISGFFGAGGLSELKAGLSDLLPANMQTSTDLPTGQ